MAEIDAITNFNKKPYGVTDVTNQLVKQVRQIKNNEMYQRIDNVIFECIGRSITFNQLLQHIKISDPAAYEYVIVYAQQILNPTYALP